MSAEEFEKIFGNIPFEDIKKIQEYIDKNYISKQEIKEKIKELETEHKQYENEWEIKDEIQAQIDILQELLEE